MNNEATMTKGKHFINWTLCSIEPINEEDAKRHQTFKGYMPMGYSFEDFKCEKKHDSEGREYYSATWKCYSSCD